METNTWSENGLNSTKQYMHNNNQVVGSACLCKAYEQ